MPTDIAKRKRELVHFLLLLVAATALAYAIGRPLGFREHHQYAIVKITFFVLGVRLYYGEWPFANYFRSAG